jgi:uncharacterized protein YkwD
VPPASPAVTPTGVENRIGSYVNQARSSMKLGALVRDPALDALAREHALNVAKKGKNHHEGFQSRFARAHEVTGTRVFSENVHMVAAGPDPARRLVEAWLASETHRANIGNRLWNSTGIGTYTDGTGMVWAVQVFGAAP